MAAVRAPRGDGTEAMLVSAPWTLSNGTANDGGVVALLALAQLAAMRRTWAKDILFVVFHPPGGLAHWLETYHGVPGPGTPPLRGGQLQMGVNLELATVGPYRSVGILYGAVARRRALGLHRRPCDADVRVANVPLAGCGEGLRPAEGAAGRMPNLDLVNTAVRAAQAEAAKVHLHSDPTPLPWLTAALDGRTALGATLAGLARPLVPQWGEFVSATAGLWTSVWHQASGTGLGGHAPAVLYQVEAITLAGVPIAASDRNPSRNPTHVTLTQIGR